MKGDSHCGGATTAEVAGSTRGISDWVRACRVAAYSNDPVSSSGDGDVSVVFC